VKDWRGNEVTMDEARALLRGPDPKMPRKRSKDPTPAGYAGQPGTGPTGETCKTCKHLFRNRMAKTYLKCGLLKAEWTGGRKTDILASSPACRLWEPSDA
jgi:hypothetical protein